MANIYNIGVSGLTAFQTRLATTGNNIANVNTEGYSRQSVDLATLPSQLSPTGYQGSGVTVSGIRRNYDDFIAGQLRSSISSSEEGDYLYTRAVQVDNVISDPAAGLSKVLGDFFNAVHDVASDPTSIPTRDVMLNQAGVLASRFQNLDDYFSELRTQANTDMASFAGEMNRLSTSIADLNARIQSSGNSGAAPPNDLLDQRDRLIDEMSKYVSITKVTQSDGQVNVFTGNGQALVLGARANTLEVSNSTLAADQRTLYLVGQNGSKVDLNGLISGGRLGGLLRFQKEVLNPAQDALGHVAIGLAHFFNQEHQTGMDLSGDLGTDFFSQAAPQLLGDSANAGTATATFSDISQVQPEEYDLRYDGASWQLIRASDSQVVPMSGSGTAADPFIADGVAIVIGPGAAAGDRYLLRPTRAGAANMDVLITDPRDIAAADAIRTSALDSNTGTGAISAGDLVSRTGNTKLAAPITLTYDAVGMQYNISAGGSIPYDPATDSGSNATVTIAGLGDFTFKLTGNPANGDQLVLQDNTGGVGDNRNARLLASLQTKNVLSGSTASVTDAYASAVADVGTSTSRAENIRETQLKLMERAQANKDGVSGVNLDEEAANLVQFQQAYQASAQVIAAANTLIDTLLGIVR